MFKGAELATGICTHESLSGFFADGISSPDSDLALTCLDSSNVESCGILEDDLNLGGLVAP